MSQKTIELSLGFFVGIATNGRYFVHGYSKAYPLLRNCDKYHLISVFEHARSRARDRNHTFWYTWLMKELVKLVVFVPEENADDVRNALGKGGAVTGRQSVYVLSRYQKAMAKRA